MIFNKAQRRARFEALPEALQEIMLATETGDAVARIVKKYLLSDEQTPKLAREVGTVILGLIPKEKFVEQLVAELSLPPEQARAVAGEVEKEIFKNIPRPPQADTPLKGGVGIPQNSPLKGSTRSSPIGERRGGMSVIPQPPPRLADSAPLLNQGGDERKVPIRKPPPPPPLLRQGYAGQAPQLPTIQSLLTDIKRGTAYDDRRINDAYRKTPIEVRQTLESVGFLSRLENIAKKFGLNVEETGELVSESGLVMLGLTLPVHFVDNLGKRLRLPRVQAMAVGQAVNMEVLRPVREVLRKMGQPTQNTPPPPSKESDLRFAPSVPTHSAPAPFPRGSAERSEAKGWNSVQKPPPPPSQARGTPPYQGGEGNKQSGYTSDPYREPIE